MRKFCLRAASGEVYSLHGAVFFYQPRGLGFTWTAKYAHTINGAYIETDRKLSQNTVTGDIVFTVNPYQKYKELLKFLAVNDDLYLGYQPIDGGDWYYLHGIMAQVSKTELTATGVLRVPVQFRATSVWRRENPIEVSIRNDTEQLTYEQTYNYSYGDDNASGAYTFTADGHFPAAVVIEADGELVSPVITLTDDASGAVIGRCAVSSTIQSGSKLLLNTVPNESGVWSVSANGTQTDLLNSINLSNNNFFRLPVGKSCTITITAGSSQSASARLQIYEYFGSV